VSTFSPDGKVFQTEYAQKAIDNSGCAALWLNNAAWRPVCFFGTSPLMYLYHAAGPLWASSAKTA
jgi:Proteasome subunit A N-terminal signature